jgi:hypothetical protein
MGRNFNNKNICVEGRATVICFEISIKGQITLIHTKSAHEHRFKLLDINPLMIPRLDMWVSMRYAVECE